MALFHFHRNVSFDFKGAGPWEGEAGGEVLDGAVVGVRAEGECVVAVKEGGEDVIKAGVLFGKAGNGMLGGGIVHKGGGVLHIVAGGELCLQWDADVGHKANIFGVANGTELQVGTCGVLAFAFGEGVKTVGNESVGAKHGANGANAIAGGVPSGVGVKRIKIGAVGEGIGEGRVGLVGLGNVSKAKDDGVAV